MADTATERLYEPRSAAEGHSSTDRAIWVYFVRPADGGPIKIGKARNIWARFSNLQTSHWCDLQLMGATPGGRTLERALHLEFGHDRLRGEWFKESPALRQRIRLLCDTPDGVWFMVTRRTWGGDRKSLKWAAMRQPEFLEGEASPALSAPPIPS